MLDNKGISEFLSWMIALVIMIIFSAVIVYIFLAGSSSIRSLVQSPNTYVTQTDAALTAGFSIVTGPTVPSFSDNQFMAQFYGSPQCISLLDQLSRTAILTTPNNPASLNGYYFVCSGSFNIDAISPSQATWAPTPEYPDNASFPGWFSSVLNSKDSKNTSGVNNSVGTMSFFTAINNPSAALGSSCVSFLDAVTQKYGSGVPSAYITSMECAPLPLKNSIPTYISIKDGSCSADPASCPLAFLHGNPGSFQLQTCTYSGGSSIVCDVYMS